MDVVGTFTTWMNELNALTSTQDKVEKLEEISTLFDGGDTPPQLKDVVQASDVIKALAEVMNENKSSWMSLGKAWITTLVGSIFFYMEWEMPHDQTKLLVEVVVEYLSLQESHSVVILLIYLVLPTYSSLMLLKYPAVYNTLKRICLNQSNIELRDGALRFMQYAVVNTEWNYKVITDRQFLQDLLVQPCECMWVLLSSLSRHPDAKSLLPPEVVKVASSFDSTDCVRICATLCNEADATSLKLSSTFLETAAQQLEGLLSIQNKVGTTYPYGILSVTVPFVNLSIADDNKEHLGKRLIPLLKAVLAIERDKPLIAAIARNLERGKQEAAKTLWNLAFVESNRIRIADNGGLELLETLLNTTADDLLKSNIEGILFMFARESHEPVPLSEQTPESNKGHIMISYNWAHQPTIIRLAKSLKDKGYNVWLDIEKMKGSTLEAMAEAIEGSEVVLMCMAQKYKDSPNCRLEGEYCVTRKIDCIPLLLQKEYKPDGWLGIALGTKLWYNFTTEDDWDNKIDTLVGVLGERGKSATTTKLRDQTQAPNAKKTPLQWSNEDMLAWMQSEGIEHHYDLFVKHNLTGKRLLSLRALENTAVLALKEYHLISSLGDALDIMNALKTL